MHALPLPETFDRKAVSAFARTLLDHRGADAVLDASQVRRMGTLAVEMLISARKQWQADGRSLTIREASDPFLTTLEAVGASVDLLQTGGPA
ncbi:STAS domain-containing protein [Paracoccus aestuarii]|nr:STAS domain-containing protein [Paracoccus aestuarii]WCR00330.1 STAS domain-containing protein [Paracoccus aestuarii]